MFRVLVLGGLALVSSQDACGSTTNPGDGGMGDAQQATDGFPSELPVILDAASNDARAADAAPADAATSDAFPSELPSP